MELITMPLGAYQTNCYLLYKADRQDCLVIDPGYEPETVLSQVKRLGKTVAAILTMWAQYGISLRKRIARCISIKRS